MGTVIGSIGMSEKGQKVLEEALALPPEDRADLAATLIESLDEKEDEAVEEAWAREIQQRMREVESGAVKTVPWSEARKRILALRDARTRS
jgi:putative addiction module component (TIGR02574 family)